jgi:putative ABC transport system permease protein
MNQVAGTLSPLASGTLIVDNRSAERHGLTAGQSVNVKLARADVRLYTVAGIYTATNINTGFYIAATDAATGFASPAPAQGFVTLTPGTQVDTVLPQVDRVLQGSPEVSVSKVDDFVAQQAQIFDFILVFVQLLLGLALIIAVFGVINTLALSMTERTRELGLLRAVGMKRGQVMWMVTVESVVICVFGAILGIVVGLGLGVTVFQALREEGFTELAFPWPLMVIYLIASVIVGLIAGLIPAVRAARQNVLTAIAYE